MGPGNATAKIIDCKYPNNSTSTAILGDSQAKYLYQYFYSLHVGTPAFIPQSGARISEVSSLLEYVPASTETLILHIGSYDVPMCSGKTAFANYRHMLNYITKQRPEIRGICVSLVLPRSCNRRRDNQNQSFVHRCSKSAGFLNQLLHNSCRRSRLVFYVEHGFEWLAPSRVLASEGLHLSFEGFALLACHYKQLRFCSPQDASSSSWQDSTSSENVCHMPRTSMTQVLLDNSSPDKRARHETAQATKIHSITTRVTAATESKAGAGNATKGKTSTSKTSGSKTLRTEATTKVIPGNNVPTRSEAMPNAAPNRKDKGKSTRTMTTTTSDSTTNHSDVDNTVTRSATVSPVPPAPTRWTTRPQPGYRLRSNIPDPAERAT
ncbi:hypothetical protein HPB50_005762 [Hyalomma asiaticum]|uniref:Uncharacterized protein n=1 Tax=Hyalomma asiaticum TaxID=266040 RepID=A0ACB7T6F8_HYAAI|nr:hypothetical protein HPB50_005762 [Hyalomma asiaticum]